MQYHLQVIFNGKIVTPQSLLGRKPPSNGAGHHLEGPRRSASWAPKDLQEGSNSVSSMIEETEFPGKSAAGKAKRYCIAIMYDFYAERMYKLLCLKQVILLHQ